MQFIFFGTDSFSTRVLQELEIAGLLPTAVVTAPDREKGRGLEVAESDVKQWARQRKISVLQFEKLDQGAKEELKKFPVDVYVVASYGLIIPKSVLDIPPKGALNVHPSLLPKYRGASPVQSAILNGEEETGVSIMLMDEKMDHGAILSQEKFEIFNSKFKSQVPTAPELEQQLAARGGKLLSEVLPKWVGGEINAVPQDDNEATYTKKITKSDGEIHLNDDPWKNFLKIRALEGWPGTYFFVEKQGKKVRVLIKGAELRETGLMITRTLPEGGKEMSWEDFRRGFLS